MDIATVSYKDLSLSRKQSELQELSKDLAGVSPKFNFNNYFE